MAIVVGNRCNISCSYCFNYTHDTIVDGTRAASPRMTQESEISAFVLALRERGYSYVTLTGGEPLVYRHTAIWLRHLRWAGIGAIVITNLTILPRWIDPIVLQWPELEFHVSIGGADAKHHNRDRELFADTARNLDRLVALHARFALSMVLTAGNFASLPEAELLAGRLGCALHVSPESIDGRSTLSNVERGAWDELIASIHDGGLRQELHLMKEIVLSGTKPKYCHMTTLGHVLQDDGELVGCFFRGDVAFGNVLRDDPGAVLDRAYSPVRASADCFGIHCAGIHLH